jgi:Spy/CpxP family protein refolding chaperone
MKIHKVGLIAVLAVATLLAYSPALRAQEKKEDGKKEGPPAGKRADMMKERLNKMAEDLKLTDEQKPKVESLLKAQAEKLRGLRDATPEERQEKMKASRAEMSKKMKEILTAEQFEKWQKQRAEMRAGGPGGKKKSSEEKQ